MKVTDLTSFRALQILIAAICILIPAILRCNDRDEFYPEKVNLVGLKQIKNCESTIKIDTTIKNYKCGAKDTITTLKVCNPAIDIISAVKIPKDQWGFRPSISHYAHSSNGYLFGMLYCIAAMLFIYNGVVYMKINYNKKIELSKSKKYEPWYNLAIGICLLFVILNPVRGEHCIAHIIFSSLFFAGNILMIVFFPSYYEKKINVKLRVIIGVIAIIILALSIYFHQITVLWAEWISLTVIAFHLIMVTISAKKHLFKN